MLEDYGAAARLSNSCGCGQGKSRYLYYKAASRGHDREIPTQQVEGGIVQKQPRRRKTGKDPAGAAVAVSSIADAYRTVGNMTEPSGFAARRLRAHIRAGNV